MRLWSIHPEYLDVKGLVALWREGLLAQKVLANKTKGYKLHPQLIRFKRATEPLAAIGIYLYEVYLESCKRGYNFSQGKIIIRKEISPIPINKGQLIYEFQHLRSKLKLRDKKKYEEILNIDEENPKPNSAFFIVSGGVEEWEKLK